MLSRKAFLAVIEEVEVRPFRKATIKEVASLAGVSTATVSCFVNGRESVCSKGTAHRIRAAVSELNYTPNSLAGGLRRGATATLGLCILSPLDPRVTMGNFFLERLWCGITVQADAEDFAVLHYPASIRSSERFDMFLDGRVDGLIFHACENVRAGRVAAAGMPTVLLTRSRNLPDHCAAAYADEAQTVNLALSYLWELGHRRIAHLAGPVGESPGHPDDIAVARLEAYEAWMQSRRCNDPVLLGYAGAWTPEHVPQIVAAWRGLSHPPTAVFCANDALALAVIAAAQSLGWDIPNDLSVIGVDNSPSARDGRMALTSVDVPVEDIGREAVSALLRLMRGAPLDQCRTALPVTHLAVRDSTARPLSV